MMDRKPALSDRVHTAGPVTVHPARSWQIAPAHALIAAAFCWAGFAAITALVLTGRGASIDQSGLMFWRAAPTLVPRGPAWLLEAVRDYTALGGVLLRHIFAAGAIAALLFMALRREAIIVVATIVSGWGVNTAIKLLVGRPRPEIVPHLTEAGGASFPSGHSFNAAVVYLAIALALAALSPRREVRWTVIAAALAGTALIALSRVWLGVHFPTDAAAGWLGGTAWAFTATALFDRPARKAAQAATKAA